MKFGLAKFAFAAVALMGAGAAIYAYGGYGASPTTPVVAQEAQAPRATAVEAVPVEVTTMADVIQVVGTTRSNEAVLIRPEIAGRVARIRFREGERVPAGAPLVELDASVYQAELEEARASLNLSRRNFDRAEELFKKGAGSARQRDEAIGQLQVDQARLSLAEARLEKTMIAAPFEGVLGLREVSVGEYVTPGQDLVNLEDIDPIKVEFRIPATSFSLLREGQQIEIEVDSFPDETFTGEVYAIDPRIDAAGRSVAVRASVPNERGLLRPGLFARVTLIVDQRQNAIVVPESAIVPREGAHFVFRAVDGKAVETKVTLGLRRSGKVEIVSGLSAGDVVVTAGQLKLRDGSPIEVVSARESA